MTDPLIAEHVGATMTRLRDLIVALGYTGLVEGIEQAEYDAMAERMLDIYDLAAEEAAWTRQNAANVPAGYRGLVVQVQALYLEQAARPAGPIPLDEFIAAVAAWHNSFRA